MATIETKIAEAIRARVHAMPMVTTHDVAWTDGDVGLQTPAGTTYTPSPTKRYLRCTWTPNATQRAFIGSADPDTRPGILQIDVMGLKTQSSGVAREVAGQVALQFPKDRRLTFEGVKLRVLKSPSVYVPFIATHVQVPVEIQLAYE